MWCSSRTRAVGPRRVVFNRSTSKNETIPVPVTISDQLPEGLTADLAGVSAIDNVAKNAASSNRYDNGEGASFSNDCASSGEGGFSCTYNDVV